MFFSSSYLTKALMLLLSVGAYMISANAQNVPSFVGSATCTSCHAKENAEWKDSFHQQAMADATPETVRGNFNNTKFNYNGIVSTFFKRGKDFFVNTDGPDGKLQDLKIDFTFGVFPLQQYLVKFPDGRMQALSIAWDCRPVKDGGQRWFHLYQNEKVDHKDVLHWTKLGQNWNYMCAECHSTNLQKNYSPETKTYHSTWSEISVGCEACHGPASAHLTWAEKKEAERSATDLGFAFSFKSSPFIPEHDPKDGRTLPETHRARSVEMDACGRCHSRRSVIAKDYTYGQPLMATHFPSLLTSDLYHADGQIKDEVYEYGSFGQSKMYQSGVSCSNCHNPHSLKLRLPGNAVCGQCHQAAKYDAGKHHFHKVGSPGAECKSCHMPEKKYMVIDPRFDHSMRIPAPAMSAKLGAPDACTSCHKDRSIEWAAQEIRTRFGPAKPNFHNFGETLAQAYAGDSTAVQKLAELLSEISTPAIIRATSAEELAPYLSSETVSKLAGALSDKAPSVRAAVLGALEAAPQEILVQLVAPLLNDPVLGVRIEAARVLAVVPQDKLPQESLKALEKADAEYLASQSLNAESPQAQINIGVFYAKKGLPAPSEKAYRLAMELEPSFIPAYVNLADLFRQVGRDKDGVNVLESAIKIIPSNAEAHFALGLLQVRLGQKQEAARTLKTAATLQPDNLRFSYVYIIALNELGKKVEARKFLALAKKRFPNSSDLTSLEEGLR